jgi:hypothetical protein
LFSYENPEIEGYGNVQIQYEKMRKLVLEKYDRVWIVEQDMIVPPDALEKLLAVDADVVSGYYRLRHGHDKTNLFSITGRTLRTNESIVSIGGGAMGCLLVRKRVLEGFSFILSRPVCPDGEFMAHCRKNNFSQVARLDVICGHQKPDGEIIYP